MPTRARKSFHLCTYFTLQFIYRRRQQLKIIYHRKVRLLVKKKFHENTERWQP
jgi:hypothetical protein